MCANSWCLPLSSSHNNQELSLRPCLATANTWKNIHILCLANLLSCRRLKPGSAHPCGQLRGSSQGAYWRKHPHLFAHRPCFSHSLDWTRMTGMEEEVWRRGMYWAKSSPPSLATKSESGEIQIRAHHQVRGTAFGKLLRTSGNLWSNFDQSSKKNSVWFSARRHNVLLPFYIQKFVCVPGNFVFLPRYYHFSKRQGNWSKKSKGEICGIWYPH